MQQVQHDRFLGIEAVFCLVIDNRLVTFNHILCNFITRVNGHVVHDLGPTPGHQGRIDLVGQHQLTSPVLFRLVRWVIEIFHVQPGVGVYVIGL